MNVPNSHSDSQGLPPLEKRHENQDQSSSSRGMYEKAPLGEKDTPYDNRRGEDDSSANLKMRNRFGRGDEEEE